MLTEDIRVDFIDHVGVDIIFDLNGYDPSNGDYYEIVNGIATLVKG